MKKFTILALSFALGLSSCGLFDAVPMPTDYPYLFLAYDVDDVLLCTPEPGSDYLGRANMGGVDDGIDEADNIVIVLNVKDTTAKVRISSSIPYWMVVEANGSLLTPTVAIAHQRPDKDEEGNFTNVLTVKDGTEVLFTITWPKVERVLFGYPLVIPQFGGFITIKRVAKDFTGTVRFYVSGNDIWDRWTDCVWTGFDVEFK
ncbi:MAG: hypothetical protein FWE99_04845 [Bacteroidales bacterium]|nr:hypothetical protein [Bacteroidales bacterium]